MPLLTTSANSSRSSSNFGKVGRTIGSNFSKAGRPPRIAGDCEEEVVLVADVMLLTY